MDLDSDTDGSDDAADANGDGSDADTGSDADVAPMRLALGVTPIAAVSDGDEPSAVDEIAAHLQVAGTGAQVVHLTRAWWSLFDPGGTPNPAAWELLGQASSAYAESGVHVALTIAVVDRTIDVRQTPWTGNWASDATFDGGKLLVDRAYETFGDQLLYLGLGYEIDRWLERASPSERTAFETFALRWLSYARQHDAKPDPVLVGITASVDGIAAESLPEFSKLLAASDVVMATHVPFDGHYQARPIAELGADLDRLVEVVIDSHQRKLALAEVGYPSATSVGSSNQNQRRYFETLFEEIGTRPGVFEFVNVLGLHDLTGDRCAFEAAALGDPDDQVAQAFRCSLGIRQSDSAEKPAYPVVLEALATLGGF